MQVHGLNDDRDFSASNLNESEAIANRALELIKEKKRLADEKLQKERMERERTKSPFEEQHEKLTEQREKKLEQQKLRSSKKEIASTRSLSSSFILMESEDEPDEDLHEIISTDPNFDFGAFEDVAKSGQLFKKHKSSKPKPEPKFLTVKYDGYGEPMELNWGKSSTLDLGNIKLVAHGHYTPTFKARTDQYPPATCFSIIAKKRILDLTHKNPKVVRFWVQGLREMIGQSLAEAEKYQNRLVKRPPKAKPKPEPQPVPEIVSQTPETQNENNSSENPTNLPNLPSINLENDDKSSHLSEELKMDAEAETEYIDNNWEKSRISGIESSIMEETSELNSKIEEMKSEIEEIKPENVNEKKPTIVNNEMMNEKINPTSPKESEIIPEEDDLDEYNEEITEENTVSSEIQKRNEKLKEINSDILDPNICSTCGNAYQICHGLEYLIPVLPENGDKSGYTCTGECGNFSPTWPMTCCPHCQKTICSNCRPLPETKNSNKPSTPKDKKPKKVGVRFTSEEDIVPEKKSSKREEYEESDDIEPPKGNILSINRMKSDKSKPKIRAAIPDFSNSSIKSESDSPLASNARAPIPDFGSMGSETEDSLHYNSRPAIPNFDESEQGGMEMESSDEEVSSMYTKPVESPSVANKRKALLDKMYNSRDEEEHSEDSAYNPSSGYKPYVASNQNYSNNNYVQQTVPHKLGPVEIGRHNSFDMPNYVLPEFGNTVEDPRYNTPYSKMNHIPAEHKRGPVEIGRHHKESFDMPEYNLPDVGNTIESPRFDKPYSKQPHRVAPRKQGPCDIGWKRKSSWEPYKADIKPRSNSIDRRLYYAVDRKPRPKLPRKLGPVEIGRKRKESYMPPKFSSTQRQNKSKKTVRVKKKKQKNVQNKKRVKKFETRTSKTVSKAKQIIDKKRKRLQNEDPHKLKNSSSKTNLQRDREAEREFLEERKRELMERNENENKKNKKNKKTKADLVAEKRKKLLEKNTAEDEKDSFGKVAGLFDEANYAAEDDGNDGFGKVAGLFGETNEDDNGERDEGMYMPDDESDEFAEFKPQRPSSIETTGNLIDEDENERISTPSGNVAGLFDNESPANEKNITTEEKRGNTGRSIEALFGQNLDMEEREEEDLVKREPERIVERNESISRMPHSFRGRNWSQSRMPSGQLDFDNPLSDEFSPVAVDNFAEGGGMNLPSDEENEEEILFGDINKSENEADFASTPLLNMGSIIETDETASNSVVNLFANDDYSDDNFGSPPPSMPTQNDGKRSPVTPKSDKKEIATFKRSALHSSAALINETEENEDDGLGGDIPDSDSESDEFAETPRRKQKVGFSDDLSNSGSLKNVEKGGNVASVLLSRNNTNVEDVVLPDFGSYTKTPEAKADTPRVYDVLSIDNNSRHQTLGELETSNRLLQSVASEGSMDPNSDLEDFPTEKNSDLDTDDEDNSDFDFFAVH